MGQVIIDSNRRYVGIKENLIFCVANGGQCLSFKADFPMLDLT